MQYTVGKNSERALELEPCTASIHSTAARVHRCTQVQGQRRKDSNKTLSITDARLAARARRVCDTTRHCIRYSVIEIERAIKRHTLAYTHMRVAYNTFDHRSWPKGRRLTLAARRAL